LTDQIHEVGAPTQVRRWEGTSTGETREVWADIQASFLGGMVTDEIDVRCRARP